MSCFKRAEWHSGLTYRVTCPDCKTVMEYTDEILDFRPWFADGFVYCVKCRKPLRHSETLAINNPAFTVVQEGDSPKSEPTPAPAPVAESVVQEEDNGMQKFCSQCGNRFTQTDRFCSQCGAKRN